jgi:hypothetical protein
MRSAHAEKPENSAIPPEDTPISERPQKFSVAQAEFLHVYAASPYMSESAICREVGIQPKQLNRWKKKSADFKKAMETEYRRSQLAANMSRRTVLNGMLKAVQMAEDKHQPSTMISGWKEIARMCGYYEPERREILLSVDSKQLLEEIQTLPKNKLLELWHEQQAVDGEFEVIDAP